MLWVDGDPAPGGSVLDRGLEFGDGLFETVAVHDGRPRLLARHLARLAVGCRRLGIMAPEPSALTAELEAAARLPGTGILKLVVTRGAGGHGYAPEPAARPRRWLAALAPRPRPAACAMTGVAVRVLATRLAEQPLLAGVKHLNRLEQVLARAELAGQADAEGLMLDLHGRLVCGTMTNVFVVLERGLVTPALERAGVAGVMRGALIDAWRAAGTDVEVRDVDPQELADARELFLTNALIGAWPVATLDGRRIGPGPFVRAAQDWVAGW